MQLSPINQKRWHNFKSNRRGFYALIIFLSLFCISLFAEVLFNDKPLIIKYQNDFYFPFLIIYPEIIFGGDFNTEADYTDPYIIDKIYQYGWIINPPIPYYYDTIIKNLDYPAPSSPDWHHLLGTDDQARDVLSRVVYGFRLSVFFALILSAVSIVVGMFMGAIQGYFGGWLDLWFQRIIEIWESIPTLYLLIIMTSIIDPNFWWILFFMSVFSWISYVGVVRAEFLRARNFDYVKAAKAIGLSNTKIMFRHILPNGLVATISFLPFNLVGSINTLASLDFLGLGLPSPSASLGELIYQGKNNLHAPWLGLSGFFILAITLCLLIFIGEAIRDAFDHQKTFTSK